MAQIRRLLIICFVPLQVKVEDLRCVIVIYTQFGILNQLLYKTDDVVVHEKNIYMLQVQRGVKQMILQ